MDCIEKIHGSLVQHGDHNDRVYVLKLGSDNPRELLSALDRLAVDKGYGKILARVPASDWPAFRACGYEKEARVPGFFGGTEDGIFAAKFRSAARAEMRLDPQIQSLIAFGQPMPRPGFTVDDEALPPIVPCGREDLPELCDLYKAVFETYPFPIGRPSYLGQVLNEEALYYCQKIDGVVVAASAAEIDRESKNAEMTDFATLPGWRGRQFAVRLLQHMENEMARMGIRVSYTIARAESLAMNRVFKGNGYRYGGVLKNNSQICGKIESMLVWYKFLD